MATPALTNAKKAAQKAAVARGRMARRAKRARFFKEHKKNILLAFIGFIIVVLLCVFTPWGPDYYYNQIQQRKMESPGAVAPGVLRDLYGLANFYNFTFRKAEAMKCYDEIGTLFFGFKISEYGMKPEVNFEQRRQAEIQIKKGLSSGPPFRVPDSDVIYVSLAIWRVGEMLHADGHRAFAYRIYKDLYSDEMVEKHGIYTDQHVNEIVKIYADKFTGRR